MFLVKDEETYKPGAHAEMKRSKRSAKDSKSEKQ